MVNAHYVITTFFYLLDFARFLRLGVRQVRQASGQCTFPQWSGPARHAYSADLVLAPGATVRHAHTSTYPVYIKTFGLS